MEGRGRGDWFGGEEGRGGKNAEKMLFAELESAALLAIGQYDTSCSLANSRLHILRRLSAEMGVIW